MRKIKLFISLLFVLFISIGQVWAEEVVYKTALFGSSYNSQSVSSYSNSWTATNDGFTVNLANWNNQNNSWTYIKTGSKNGAVVGTITTNAAIDKAITKVVVSIDAVTANNINSITLYSGASAATCSTSEGTFTKSTGTQSVTISSPTANKFYKISFDCKKSSNGCIQVSKVEFYYNNSDETGSGNTSVNVESFKTVNDETSVTMFVDETKSTVATNDQSDWTASYTYSSDKESVATVNSSGVITAKGKGTATITCSPNISNDDTKWAKGNSKTISVTVKNPDVTAHFFVDGVENDGKKIVVEGGSALGTLPTASSSDPEYTEFIGWTEAAEISVATSTCPTLISATTTISEDKNYRAVFGKAENFSFAAADNSTYNTSSLTFTDKTTGVALSISNGSRYTNGTPNTFTVSYGNNYYFQISHTTKLISSLQVTLSEAKYSIRSVDNGKLTTSSTTQTVSDINKTSVKCYAQTSSNQIRATVISGKALVSFLTKFSNDPQISVSESSLNGFEAIATAGAGAAKSFKVSGVKLQDNISVSVTGNYEICQTVDGSYTNSLTLTKGGDNKVAETTIFVRLKAHAEAAATENGSISITSTGAEDKSVTLAGVVAEKVLNSIAVKTAPTKTTYILGEFFDPAGLVITRTYNSGAEDITYASHEEEFTFSPDLETAITGSTNNVQITWGDKSVNQTITKKCSVAWFVNGSELTSAATTVGYNTKVTALPTAPTSADCDDNKVFVGWTATAIDGETDTKPTDLFTAASGAQNLTKNTTYYAVFASISGSIKQETEYSSFDNSYAEYCGVKNGLKNVNDAVKKNNIWSGITGTIQIKVYHMSNSKADVLTISLIDKDGNAVDSKDLETTKFGTSATGAGYSDYVSLTSTSSVTGFKVALKTKNSYGTCVGKVTCSVPVPSYGDYATTCCAKWTAPTLTYNYSDAIHVNDHVAATWSEVATHGTVRFVSSDTEVLTVADNGQITAVGAGRAKITAYWENDADGYCNNSAVSNEVVVTNSFNIIYKDKDNAEFTGTNWVSTQPTTHTYGSATTLVAPTKDYYNFNGWFITSDCSGDALTELVADGYTEDITLYAKWTAKEYAITYNNVDGATHSNPENFTVESDEIVLAVASKTGHAFLGWYDAETDGNKVTSIVPAETHAAVELWAKWSVNSYAIDWSFGGGQVSATSPAYTTAGSIAYNTAITAPVVEREGYRFAGWKCNDAAVDFGAEVLMPAAPATYVAQWVKVWTVDFQNNGVSLAGYPKTIDENAALGELPSGEGLVACHATSTTFMGWSTEEIIVPGDKPADNTFATAETTVTGNLVYNAVWAKSSNDFEGYKLVSSLTTGKKYIFVSSNTAGDAKAMTATAVTTNTSSGAKVSTTAVTIKTGTPVYIEGYNTNLEFVYNVDNTTEIFEIVGTLGSEEAKKYLYINGNGISRRTNSQTKWDSSNGLYGWTGSNTNRYVYLNNDAFSISSNTTDGRVYAFERVDATYSEYVTNCTDEVVYDIELDDLVTNGTIEADKYKALAGDKITLTATPAPGYQLEKWEVVDGNADWVDVENDQFDMPESNVLVSATFEKIPVSSISLSFTSIDVEKNGIPELPTVSYLPTTILESQKGVNWISDDEETVVVEDGYILAYEVGQATLTATSATNPLVTATLAVNVYGWNLATTDAYVVTPGTLDNLTDAKSFTASEWGVKANYVRSDNAELTKQEIVADWKAFIGETEIADGYQYQLTDDGKTLYIKVGDVVAAEYTLSITAVAKDKYVDLVHDTYKVSEEINYIYMAGDGYTIPTIANAEIPAESATDCKETHYVFKGWVTEANKDVPTDANLISATGTNDADGSTTYYAVWAEKKTKEVEKTLYYGWEDNQTLTGWTRSVSGFAGAVPDYKHTGSKSGKMTSANYIYTSVYSKPVSIKYYIAKASTNTNSDNTIKFEYASSTSGPWTTVDAATRHNGTGGGLENVKDASSSWTEISLDLTDVKYQNKCFRIVKGNTAEQAIDDLTFVYKVTEDVESDYITECVERYELSFENNGGTGESFESVKVKKDGTFTLPTPTTLNKDLNDFTGWNTTATGEGDHYDANDTYIMGEENVTLYAEWTPWKLESLTLTTSSVKTAYGEGETFTSEGLVVKANYVDTKGEAKPAVVVEGWTTNLDENDGHVFTHAEDGTQTVTVSYKGVTATYDVTVTTYPNVTFYVNNEVYTTKASKDGKMVFPAVPTITDVDNDFTYFVGWTKAEYTGIAAPVMAQVGDAVNDGDIFHAVFGKVEVESTKEKTLTIDKSALPQSGWGSYNWVKWNHDGMSGQIMAYFNSDYIQMNMDDRIEAMFNETMLPGDIKSVKITANKGTTKKWEIYASNVMFDQTATGGTKIGDAKEVSTTGDTWTVPAGDSYRYFMCKLTEKGASYIDKFEITYADPTYVAYSTKVGQIEKYTRENISGTFGTICLPKAVEAGMFEGATFFEGDYLLMQGGMPYKYYLSEVDHLEAGYPYVFVLNEGSTSITLYQSGAEESAHNRKGLVGTLSYIGDWDTYGNNILTNNYFVKDGEFRKCGVWCGLSANRAYLNINNSDVECKSQEEPAQVGGRKRIALINASANTTTGVEEVLNGRDEEIRKQMINGVIYVIRGGKIYDLNGRLVK